MKHILSLVAAAGFLVAGSSALAQQPSQPFLFGVWEGNMTVVQQQPDGQPIVGLGQGEQFPFRLDIRDTNLVFYFRQPDGWSGIGEGSDLRLNQAGRSATVVAAMSDGDPSETWMINVARWDEETIVVYLSRMVSDGGGQPPVPFGAMGQMRRVSDDG